MTPDEYCKDKAVKSGSSFYYSFLFLEETQRRAITALYAFCREVDDIVDECNEIEVAQTKLNWWREEIAKLYQSNPQHPITKALLPLLDTFNLQESYLLEIIDGMEMDLQYDSYPTFTELSLYCYRAASVVGILAAEIFGYDDHKTLKYANDLGMALQLTNILRDVREDLTRSRVYIPLDELERFSVTTDMLSKGQMTPEIESLLQFQAERAQQYYTKAYSKLPDKDRYKQRCGLVMGNIYHALLEEIQNDNFNVMDHKVSLTPIRKLWIAWKTIRKEKKLFRQYAKQS